MSGSPLICVVCGKPSLEDRHKRKAWDEEPCRPGNCSVWQVIGKSQAGGPLLQVVQP